MATFLEQIVAEKRERVARLQAAIDPQMLRERAFARPRTGTSFREAVSDPNKINVIAEFKRASPSKGVIASEADAAQIAAAYQSHGASAVSVLTEEAFFLGNIDDLVAVRQAVTLPLLRKDFVIDEVQIYEAAAAGADAVLLIAAVLDADTIYKFCETAKELGLAPLLEVHDAREMQVADAVGAELIGVNNRNLRTFEVSLDVCRDLVGLAPANSVLIAESGITSAQDIIELKGIGYSAFLVGEALMRGTNLQDLL